MRKISKFLDKIRKRPGLHLYPFEINNLYFYLSGYISALLESKELDKNDVYFGFQDYIQKQFKLPETSQHWREIIRSEKDTEQEAFDYFWELWDEYLEAVESGQFKPED